METQGVEQNGKGEEVREEYLQMKEEMRFLLHRVTQMIENHYDDCGRPQTTQITNFVMPNKIISELGPITEKAASRDDVIKSLETVFKYSTKTMHPFFLDKLYAGTDPIGQIAELVTSVLNTATHVYHVSPVFSCMEVESIRILGEKFGFKADRIDGTLNPGGSMSNFMALFAARHEHFPHVRKQGWQPGDKPVIFASVQSHYSVSRGAMVSGMGTENVVQVPSINETGQMDPLALDRMIQEQIDKGNKPFFLNSTAGTTVLGAFDNHNAMADICKKYGLWHHVDACWGGFLIWADDDKKKVLFDGISRADSIAFCCHKGMGIPLQCTCLITNGKKDALRKSNTSGADYLFHESEYSSYDLGDKTLSCGRHADGLKLWLSMQRHGFEGYRKIANSALKKAEYITQQIKERDDFKLVREPAAVNVCCWYIPPYFREHPTEYDDNMIINVHKAIFDRFQTDGRCIIQHNPLAEFKLPNFFRLVLKCEKTRVTDMDFLLDEIARLGADLKPETFATETEKHLSDQR